MGVFLGVWAGLLLSACGATRAEFEPSADSRTLVVMSSKEREHLRHGMHVYLDSLQGVAEALAEHKMARVAQHARKAGSAAIRDVPISVVLTLPPGFALLGSDTHQRFDALAAAAAAHASTSEVLRQLGDILANCNACHASYRIARK